MQLQPACSSKLNKGLSKWDSATFRRNLYLSFITFIMNLASLWNIISKNWCSVIENVCETRTFIDQVADMLSKNWCSVIKNSIWNKNSYDQVADMLSKNWCSIMKNSIWNKNSYRSSCWHAFKKLVLHHKEQYLKQKLLWIKLLTCFQKTGAAFKNWCSVITVSETKTFMIKLLTCFQKTDAPS